NPGGDGPYVKSAGPHNGAVYAIAGTAGRMDTATRSMPVIAVHLNELGSMVLDVSGRELQARFLNNTGTLRDTFAILHNTAPLATAATVNGPEDTPLPLTLSATDPENDLLTWEIVAPPPVGSLAGTAPNVTYT